MKWSSKEQKFIVFKRSYIIYNLNVLVFCSGLLFSNKIKIKLRRIVHPQGDVTKNNNFYFKRYIAHGC
jgi:hypothetical protein